MGVGEDFCVGRYDDKLAPSHLPITCSGRYSRGSKEALIMQVSTEPLESKP